jgi:hypothetical protein
VHALPQAVQGRARHRARLVFFPFNNLQALEDEVLYLMEVFGLPYRDIMSMPSGRRRRFADEKEHIDRWRAARQEAEAARAKKGRR